MKKPVLIFCFILLLSSYFTVPAYSQLEFTEIGFEYPRTQPSNPSTAVELDGKVYILIRDGLVVWNLASDTWEKKDVNIQPGFNYGYLGVINSQIITFPYYLNDPENAVFGREPAILDPATFELHGIRDINPNGSSVIGNIYSYHNKVYFLANDGINGLQLWATDGTHDGTVMLTSIENPSSNALIWIAPFLDRVIINYNRQSLWISDGTLGGTSLLVDFGEQISSLPILDSDYVTVGSECFFTFTSTSGQKVVWKSDGTTDGTAELTDFSSYEFAGPIKLSVLNGQLFAFGTEYNILNYPFRILKIDPSTGEKESLFIQQQLGGIVGDLAVFDGEVYYAIYGSTSTSGIWRFDGSLDGVELIKNIPELTGAQSYPMPVDNGFYWAITTGSSGQELWYSDKTEEGTFQVKDTKPGVYGGMGGLLGSFENTLFFAADNGNTGFEPWVSKGTPETTFIIDDFETSADYIQPRGLKVVEEFLYFNVNRKPNLFKLVGNQLVDVINQSNFQASTYSDIESFKSQLYFGSKPDYQTLYPEDNLYHLFSYDGTDVSSVKAISRNSSGPKEFSVANDVLFFVAGSPTYGDEYWISDGTADGTKMLKDINPGSAAGFSGWLGFSDVSGVVYLDGSYYFSASGSGQGHELWKTDLTESGTELLKEINVGEGHSYPMNLTVIGSRVFFTAAEDGSNFSTWVTDGTEAGTIKLVDRLGSSFYRVGGQIYIVTRQYISESNKNQFKIWETDGTQAGTTEWRTLGEFQSIDAPAAQIQAGLVFVEGSEEGWSYSLVTDTKEIVPILSEHPASPSFVFTKDQNVYFVTTPLALWVSDGSVAGTSEIEIDQPIAPQSPQQWAIFGDDLVFGSGNYSLWSLNLFEAQFETKLDGQVILQNEVISLESSVGNGEPFTLEILNKGYANLDLTGAPRILISGLASEEFSVIAAPGETIGINKSSSLSVEFNPKSTGVKEATLVIEINDGRGLITFNLKGTGNKATPSISFSELPTKSILDAPFDLMASVDTDQEISFSSSNPEIASIEGKTVTIHKAGTVTITASVAATELYNAASKQQSLTINGVEQTITFDALPEKTFGDATFELSATASSGLDVTFSSSDASVASVEGVTVSILKAGAVTITASQAGNDNYSSATATQSLTINKAAQTITFATLPAKSFGDEPFTLSASTTSGLTLAYASSDATVAKVGGTTATLLKPGSATITASQTGNENYLAAASVEQSLVVNKAGQTITFEPLAAKMFGDPAFEFSATSSIGLPVVFSSSDPAVVSVEGNSASIVKAGAVTITASQAGNDNYSSATATQTLTINKASQTITFDELPTLRSDDDPIELVAEASSGLPVAFQSQDETIATMEGATLTITGSGTTSITATQGGDENYLAAAEVTRALVVEEVTGLNELAALIKVYPNPTESFIAIELPENITQVSYVLTFTTGQQVKEGRLLSQSGKVEIPFDGMPTGTYLLTLTNGELSSTWRILKN